jgi:hypothetical protein
VNVNPVAVVKVNAEKVVLVAGRSASPKAEPDGAHGRSADKPVGDINVVDVLLNDVVT